MLIKAVPYSKQNINSKDIRSVKKVLKSEYLTTGPEVKKFENVISKFVKSKYSISTNSATSALHIACLSFGLKKKRYCLDIINFIRCICKMCQILWKFSRFLRYK